MALTKAEEQGMLSGAASGAGAGAAFGPWGALIGAGVGTGLGYMKGNKRPKYNINPEYAENKALALGQSFGTSGAVRAGQAQADQDQAESVRTAQNYSSNAASILNTLSSITGKKMETQRALTGMNAQVQGQGRANLADANTALAEEKDKQWNYNTNMPYQNMVEGVNNGMGALAKNTANWQDSNNAKDIMEPLAGVDPNASGNDTLLQVLAGMRKRKSTVN